MTDRGKCFYEVIDKKFPSNVEAFSYLKRIRPRVHKAVPKFILDFDFLRNPQKYPWRQEPPLTLQYYIDMHVLLLSQRYRRVFLAYSGGTDSHPIAQSFIRQRLPVTFCVLEDNDITSPEWTYPTADWYGNHNQFLKDFSLLLKCERVEVAPFTWLSEKPSLRTLERYLSDSPWLTHEISKRNFNMPTHPDKKLDALLKESDCLIMGMEKPGIRIHKGWYCHSISDSYWLNYPPYNGDIIFFYLTDLIPELHIKSTWLMLKAIEEILEEEGLPKTDNQILKMQRPGCAHYIEIIKRMGQNPINDFERITPKRDVPETRMMSFTKALYDDYWVQSVAAGVEDRFLDNKKNVLRGLDTPLIKLRPVNA